MSDNKIMHIRKNQILTCCHMLPALLAIIAVCLAMSIDILAGTATIPYDEGGSKDIPSAAARVCNLSCGRVAGGCAYTFDIEVFPTCWKPIYAVELRGLLEGWAEPLSWPENWKAQTVPAGATYAGSMVFYTRDNPIMPGTVQSGFGFISYAGGITVRWFPADEDGILVGKMTRLDLACPTGTEASSWGSIKAIYR
jgi:hypothetical protein